MSDPYDLGDFSRIVLAAVLGAIVGVEREVCDKPAGLRTHMFVAAGSALLVILAEGAFDFFQRRGPDEQVVADPVRVIQAIVVGISFLGAGTIVHHTNRQIEGLTTAASIFLTAGIGIAVGVDRLWLAVETSLFAVLVQMTLRWLETWLWGGPSGSRGSASQDHTAP